MKYIINIISFFIFFIIIEVAIVSIATQNLPNQIAFEIINNIDVFIILFDQDAISAIQFLLIQNPFIIIQKIEVSSSTQTWGVYIMPITTLFLFLLAVVVVILKNKGLLQKNLLWVYLACFLLIMSVFYLRVQACCTANPSWVFDVILLSRIYNPNLDAFYWQDIYLLMSPLFKPMQFVLAVSSLLMFFRYFYIENKRSHRRVKLNHQ